MTDFGLGLFSALVGGVMAAVAAAPIDAWPAQVRMTLCPMGAGAAAAAFGAWLGRHLVRPMRRSFERIVIAAVLALMPAAFAGLAFGNVWAGPAVLAALSAVIYLYIKDKPPDWGCAPRGPQRED